MVSSYYLVKLFQRAGYERIRRTLDGEGDPNSGSSTSQSRAEENKCRICLKHGNIPIYTDNDSYDVENAVRTFGDIDISEDDDYPKHLCESCHKLLESAILFRKTAKQTNQLLQKRNIKLESNSDDGNDTENEQESKKKSKSTSILQEFFSAVVSDNESSTSPTSSGKKKFSKVQCRVCLKILTKGYYKEHFNLHDPTIPKFVCDVCGKSFRQRCAYRNHYFTHSSEFPYKCNVCPYRGRNSGLLKTHMRTHTGDYRYMCTECPARFLTKSNLNKHTLKHREPEYKCDSCKRAFHSKLILARHFEAEHLGIKNHLCNLCGKAFGYRKAMMRHQLDVHKREKRMSGRMPAYLEAEQKKIDGD